MLLFRWYLIASTTEILVHLSIVVIVDVILCPLLVVPMAWNFDESPSWIHNKRHHISKSAPGIWNWCLRLPNSIIEVLDVSFSFHHVLLSPYPRTHMFDVSSWWHGSLKSLDTLMSIPHHIIYLCLFLMASNVEVFSSMHHRFWSRLLKTMAIIAASS